MTLSFSNHEGELLPGDTQLQLTDGTTIFFDSLLDLEPSPSGVEVLLAGERCIATNLTGDGLKLRRARDDHLAGLAPDQYCVTCVRDPNRSLGKVFDEDGNKSASAVLSRGLAVTIRCKTHEAMASLYQLAGGDPHAALILDHFPDIPVGESFEVLSEAQMRKELGKPGKARGDVLGIHAIKRHGRIVKAVTRLRENFVPSVWLAIDRDIDEYTPATFAQMNDTEYFAALSKALPGIDRVTRVRTLSSSARAERGGVPVGRNAGHTLVQLADPSVKDRLRPAYRSQAMATGTAWQVPKSSKTEPGKVVAHGWKCLADDATFDVGRLLFCGAPISHCPDIEIRPQQCVVETLANSAFDGNGVTPASVGDLEAATRAVGTPVTMRYKGGGNVAFEECTLKLDTEVEMEGDGIMSVKCAIEFLTAPGAPEKLRCQAPFRDSDSFAAFMRLVSGRPVLHDTGTATTYRLTQADCMMQDFGDCVDEPLADVAQAASGPAVHAPALTRRRALKVYSPAELRNMPPVEWRVQGVLPKVGIAVLYGPSGAGKSFVVLSMALALARGLEWHDHAVLRSGVLYVAAEGSSGFPGRLAAYAKHHDCNLDTVPFWLVPESIDLLGKDDPQLVIDAALARTEPVGVIVLDTLNRSMSGDENSAADMTHVIGAAGKIAGATGALVLIVTHTGKNAAMGARGHSSLRAAADAEIYVHGSGNTRIIEITKMRDGSDQLRFGFRLQPVELDVLDSAGQPLLVPVAIPVAVAGKGAVQVPKPSTWDGIVLKAYEVAVDSFEAVDTNSLLVDVLMNYVPNAYKEAKGCEPPDRWRDTAMRSVGTLVKAGFLCQAGLQLTRPH